MRINIIAAIADNLVIGKDNQLLWHLPADFKRLKHLTWGKPIIMGRKTFESIGKPLPGRQNIVITSNLNLRSAEITIASSLPEALALTNNADEVFIFGGASVYQAALPLATHMYLTIVKHQFAGDVFFPPWNEAEWHLVSRECHQHDQHHEFDYEFVLLERVTPIN